MRLAIEPEPLHESAAIACPHVSLETLPDQKICPVVRRSAGPTSHHLGCISKPVEHAWVRVKPLLIVPNVKAPNDCNQSLGKTLLGS